MRPISRHTAELAELMRCRCGRPVELVRFGAESSFVCPTCGYESGRCECEVVAEEGAEED